MKLKDDLCSHCLPKGKEVKADIIQYPIKLCNKCYEKMIVGDIKCECDVDSEMPEGNSWMYDKKDELPYVNHLAGKCECVNRLRQYKRGKKVMWLCSCCCLPDDKLIKEVKK